MVILHAKDCPECHSTDLVYNIGNDSLVCTRCKWTDYVPGKLPEKPESPHCVTCGQILPPEDD